MIGDAPSTGHGEGQVWALSQLCEHHGRCGQAYDEVLRSDALSFGIYRLGVGAQDGQSPHREDEIYVVLAGAATAEVDGERTPVRAGSVVYLPAGVVHRFVDITDELDLAVLFAPPESS